MKSAIKLDFSLERRNFRNAAGNVASMLTSDVVIRATSFIMYALVARYLGAYKFGQLSLATSLLYTFHRFALVGLETLLTREVARDKAQTSRYFLNSSFIMIITSGLSFLALVLFVRIMGYVPDTVQVIFLLFLGLLPFTLSRICEAVFRAWEQMQYIAYANVPINILQTIAVYILLARGYDIQHVVLSLVIARVAILLVEWVLLLVFITRPTLQLELRFSFSMLKTAAPFLGIQSTNALKSSMNVILLSKLLGETGVGLYSAASQLLVPLSLIFNNVVASIFPIMCRKFESGLEGLRRVTEHLLEILTAVALPATVGLFLLAEGILLLLYRDPDFLRVAMVLRIIAWTPLQNAVTTVMGQVLWASQQEKVSMRISIINTIVNLVVGVVLINRLGLIGAAVATMVVVIINILQHYFPVSKLFSRISLWRLIWKQAVASLGMAIYIMLFNSLNYFILIPSAALVYGIILTALVIQASGGPKQFQAKYRHLLFEV